jgi:hypothetical protein
MSQCGNMTGGRSRRRKMRGGNMYGFSGPIGTNGAGWSAVANTPVDPVTGAAKPEAIIVGGRRSRKMSRRRIRGGDELPAGTPETPAGAPPENKNIPPPGTVGGRRKSKKAKKSKKTSRRRSRKMRGGASSLPATAGVSGFTGEGVARGMGGFVDVSGGYARPNDVVRLS